MLATTAPWWVVRRAHAARREQLIVWMPVALAPQVDKLLQEQCYAYAKQAGLKEHEVQYSQIGTGQWLPKMVAALEAGNPPDVTQQGNAAVALYRSQGHLLEVTDLVEKLQQKGGEFFPISLNAVMYKGKAYGVPREVTPWPLVTRLDILEAAKVDPPKTWDEFIEVCKKLQKPPRLTGYGMCLGLATDTDNNVINMMWSYGGKLVEADNKTVALNAPGTVQAVKLIAEWKCLPVPQDAQGKPAIHDTTVYRAFATWAADGSLWQAFIASVRHLAAEQYLDTSVLHGDGTNTVAKKGVMGWATRAVAPYLTVVTNTTALSDAATPVRDDHVASAGSNEAGARETPTVLVLSSNDR